jgi:TolA-binding protein
VFSEEVVEMNNSRQLLMSSLGNLILVVIGLFLVCAVQRDARRGKSVDEETYKRELIELLGLDQELAPAPAETTAASPATVAEVPATQPEKAPQSQAEPEQLYALLQQLERLRREVDARSTEIARLEKESASLDSGIVRLATQLGAVEGKDLGSLDSRLPQLATRWASGQAREVQPRVALGPSTRDVSPAPSTVIRVGVAEGVQASRPVPEFERRYDEALRLFHQRQYAQALEQFQSLLAENPVHPLADNCQYWIGECLYGQRRYLEAFSAFCRVFAFDATDKYDDAQLKIALCQMRLGDARMAQQELENFLKLYPQSEYVTTARAYLSRLAV